MPKQSIIWTVLPNGVTPDGRSLRLSLLVSPRLDPDGKSPTLESFGDFLSWPTTINNSTFTLHLGSDSSTVTLDASKVDPLIGTPDDPTWTALFPKTTSVLTPHLPDRSEHTVVSYNTVEMNELVAQVYEKLTVAPGPDLPQMDHLVDLLKPLIESVAKIDGAYMQKEPLGRNVARMFGDYKNGQLAKSDTLKLGLGEFQLFHTSPNEVLTTTFEPEYDPRLKVSYQTQVSKKPNLAKAVAAIDFHQVVAAMNQYPTLLRRLGLVLDFVVPRASIPESADFTMWVTVRLPEVPALKDWTSAVMRRAASPVTHTRHNDNAFTTVSRPTVGEADLQISDGMLKFANRFALLQADVDGAGHKLINFARTLGRHTSVERQVDPITKLPRRAGAPALRNAGLMLVHTKRGQALTDAFGRNKALDDNINKMFDESATDASALYAEDVVRGWRVDIWDKASGNWRSLCERIADYDIDESAVVLSGLREEGMVRLAATSSTDGSNAGVVWLHEALTVWNGWSLVAQQPGKAIDRDDQQLRDAAAHLPDGIRLRTQFVPRPGTLPRLRYGHVYALRARAVDLAGNSLSPQAASYPGDANAIASATPYYRFEPVQPPGFALIGTKTSAKLPLAGESMARVVVRSLNDQFDSPAISTQEAQRWAVAARTSQREAEMHGVLDGAEWGTPQQYELLSARDHELAQFDVVPAASDALTGPIKAMPGTAGTLVVKTVDQLRAERVSEETPRIASYAVLPEGTQLLPYLPDPLCTRLLVRFIDHPLLSAHEPIQIPLYRKGRKWPDVSPVLIRVYEGTGEVPRFDEAAHTLLIPTPKATRATLRISSMLEDESLNFMGVWNWVRESARDEALKRRALAGKLWSLTPVREMEIVHAVQRPVLKPNITSLLLHKQAGATWVLPTVVATCHRESTIKFDLHAVWHDPRDGGITPPTDQPKDAVPFSIKITDPQGYNGLIEHVVPHDGTDNLIAFGDVKVQAEDKGRTIEPKVHDFGDTRYRRVAYQLIATSRFREYMPNDVLYEGAGALRVATDKNIKLEGEPIVTWVLNSSSPPAPEVLYVVPTFGWTRGVDAEGNATSCRKGGGLRVWLDRPWNVTGYGEMLAVVIPLRNSTVDPNEPPYKHTVTQWGSDPIWASPFVQGVAPLEANFPLRRMAPNISGSWLPPGARLSETDQPHNAFVTTSLRHPGAAENAATGAVDVVPHDVFWDADRALWYCDIEITHGDSYFPFVRLALARYQPSSLSGSHLSNVVLADFCALAPNRWLTISGSNPTRRSVRVFGNAPELTSGYAEAFQYHTETKKDGKVTVHLPVEIAKTTVIEVWVEKLTPTQGEDFGWHRVSTGSESAWHAQTADLPEPTLWSGSVDLPTAPSASARYRVVVAEYEEYLADGQNPYEGPPRAMTRRLVFVEHVELS